MNSADTSKMINPMLHEPATLVSLLSRAENKEEVLRTAVEKAAAVTGANLTCFYGYTKVKESGEYKIVRMLQIGYGHSPKELSPAADIVQFMEDSRETIVLLTKKEHPFKGLLLTPEMESGIGLPIIAGSTDSKPRKYGLLILNSKNPYYFSGGVLDFLESLRSITISMYVQKTGPRSVHSSSNRRQQ